MKTYHATTKEEWKRIQEEGQLYGYRPPVGDFKPSRCTYLALKKEDCIGYGDVILEVEFEPENDTPNNYHPDAWQVRVYAPIPIERIKKLQEENK